MLELLLIPNLKSIMTFIGGSVFTVLITVVGMYITYHQKERFQKDDEKKEIQYNTVFGNEKPGLIRGESNLLMIEQLNQHSLDHLYGECGVGVFWKFDNNTKILEIHGYGPMVPAMGYEKTFDDDAESAYFKFSKLKHDVKKLIIYEGVTYIERYTFSGFNSLEEAYIGPNIKIIPYSCFEGCINLKRVYLPYNLEEIQGESFKNCSSLLNVSIPKSVKEIGKWAFYGCRSFRRLHISSIDIIDIEAFSESGIEEIKIYDVREIRRSAFSNTKNLKSVGIYHYGDIWNGAFKGSSATTISFGRGNYISEDIFDECSSIEKIEFGVMSINFSNELLNDIFVYPEGLIKLKENVKQGLIEIPPYYKGSRAIRVFIKLLDELLYYQRSKRKKK